MNFHFVAGIVLFLLGLAFILAGASGISMRDAGDIEKRHPLFMIASLSILFSIVYNLAVSSGNWRDLKVELIALGIGTVMSLSGAILCFW